MKLFLKILAGFLILLVAAAAGLRLYFNDERLRETVVPMINQYTGTEVQIESMSLSLFSSFPHAGISMKGFVLPDENNNQVAALEELNLSVKILPLLSNEVQISELILKSPEIQYIVYENGTSNFDFLMSEESDTTETQSGGISLQVPELRLENGFLHYTDSTSEMEVKAKGINGTLALQFDQLIQTKLDTDIQSLSIQLAGEEYINNLEVSLQQSSVLNLEKETLEIEEGSLSIRSLALQLSGSVSEWSGDAIKMNLVLSSSSDNFEELLGLVPPEYEEYVGGLETRGSLKLEGNIEGALTENSIPSFKFTIEVQDGYLKRTDMPEAIQNIQLSFVADNEQVSIQNFTATAAGNTISISGMISEPLSENPGFDLDIASKADLSTVKDFYPIGELGIQRLEGNLTVDLTAQGSFDAPEKAQVDGKMILAGGLMQYEGVPKPIEDIEAEINASNREITINRAQFNAAGNRLSLSGSVNNPLDEETRSVNITGNTDIDLSSLKEFYPIDEDTLTLRGSLQSRFVLRGQLEPFDIQKLLQSSSVKISNGYIAHKSIGEPLRDINFSGNVSGSLIQITQAQFKTGNNSLAVKGSVRNYLSENPVFNLSLDGKAMLGNIENYYSLQPWVETLSGSAILELTAKGPAGDPLKIDLNGSLILNQVNAKGGELPLEVTNLNSNLNVTPNVLRLNNFSMGFGSSDIQLSGEMNNYIGLLKERVSASERPSVSGTFRSEQLDIDEMIDWDAKTDPNAPIPIELPNMNAQVSANIASMNVLGLEITNVSGKGALSPINIKLTGAQATLFEGTASGNLDWNVPKPTQTQINFDGKLNNLKASSFFRETSFLGGESNIHKYLEGALSAEIVYTSSLEPSLSPKVSTIQSEGSFGMTKSRLKGHPVQMEIANLLKIKELENVALDDWKTDFTIQNEVLTFKGLNLTSDDIGIELQGTHHLVSDKIDYKATIALPGRFKKGIANVISEQAANALEQENGTIAVPLTITGTSENPKVRPDDEVIKKIVEDYLKEKGSKIIKKLFDGN